MFKPFFDGRSRRTRTLGTWFWSKLELELARARVSRVLSLSCKLAFCGITTIDAIMMLIDVIPPRLSRFFAGQGELSLCCKNYIHPLYVSLLKTETQIEFSTDLYWYIVMKINDWIVRTRVIFNKIIMVNNKIDQIIDQMIDQMIFG